MWRLLDGTAEQRLFMPQYVTTEAGVLAISKALGFFGMAQSPSHLAIATVFCNVGVMCVLSLWVFQLTRRVWPCAFVLALFATSAWPTTYMFMWFYAPVAALYAIVSAYALLGDFGSSRKTTAARVLGWLGLLITWLSCVSAAVIVGLLGVVALMIQGKGVAVRVQAVARRRPLAFWGGLGGMVLLFVLLTLALGGLSLATHYWSNFRFHLAQNLQSNHFLEAALNLGGPLQPPFLSGVWVLWEYGEFLAIAHIGATAVAIGVLFLGRTRARTTDSTQATGAPLSVDSALEPATGGRLAPGKGGMGSPFSRLEEVIVLIAAVVWVHEILVDVLPTTKLARTHYLTLPLIYLLISLCAYWCWARLAGTLKVLFSVLLAAGIGMGAWEGLSLAARGWATRHALPRFFRGAIPRVRTVTFLPFDPHHYFQSQWLAQSSRMSTSSVPIADVFAKRDGADKGVEATLNMVFLGTVISTNFAVPDVLAALPDPAREKTALVIGPTGRDCGKSVFKHGVLPDLDFDVTAYAKLCGAQLWRFPAAAYHPPFCLEEENCQGLLWGGRIPDPDRDPQKCISVLFWSERTADGQFR